MAEAIPEQARTIVRFRARQRCELCGAPAPVGAWHHRRSRAVRDLHTHCPCNGVWLHHSCHARVHSMPVSSRLTGWIVSRFKAEPSTVPFQAPTGWCLPDCEGGTRWTAADDMAAAVAAFAKTQ